MATNLNDFFNADLNALMVVLDYRQREEENAFREALKERFEESSYLYLTGEECPKNCQELYQYIGGQMRNGIVMPRNGRFLFCHYLRLADLNEDWVQQWQSCADGFRKLVPVDDAFKQYHVIFLSYKTSDSLEEERAKKTEENLIQLGTNLQEAAHAIYLLYVKGFESIRRQEEGAAQLLYLLCRDSAANMLAPMLNRTRLKMLNYSDFSEKKAKMWQDTISDLDTWLKSDKDPDLFNFLDCTRRILLSAVQTLREAEMEFDLRADIYPVHINDFKKTGFLPGSPMVSLIGLDHKIIQKRKKEYFTDLRQRLMEQIPFGEVVSQVQDGMYYRDLLRLRDFLEKQGEGSLESRLRSSLVSGQQNRADEEIEELVLKVGERIRDLLKPELANIEPKKNQKQREKIHAQQELEIAGRFNGMLDCFDKIDQETVFRPIDGMTPAFQKSVCLIGSSCYSDWYTGKYTIRDIDTVSYCADMDPLDIALLKTGDLFDLKGEDAERNVLRVLHI